MGFEGTVRHPASLNFRLFFGPFLHAVPLRLGLAGGRPGWLRPGRALAALVLTTGLWLRGPGDSSSWVSKVPLGTLEASIFGSFLVTVPLRLGLAEGALARPWRVFLVGSEGTVRHPPSVPARSLFRRFLHAVPLRLGPAGGRPGWLRRGRALAALVLAAGLWLRGPGESS